MAANPPTVTVNLNINVDGYGNIDIFSYPADLPTENIVDSSAPLPITALYNDEGNALIEFQGVGDEMVARYCTDFTTDEDALTQNLSDLLMGGLKGGNADGSQGDAAPFNDPMYAGNASYQNYSTFGKLALASYAHYVFGHVQATAAIDNDATIVSYFDGNDADLAAPSGEAANIARKLANTILTGLSSENLLKIVKQVIGQDASRATLQDNDINAPVDGWQRLSFIDGDVVFVSITLQGPVITYGGNSSAGTQQFSPPAVDDIKYNIRMTMSSTGSIPGGGGSGGGGSGGGGSGGGGSGGGGSGGGGSGGGGSGGGGGNGVTLSAMIDTLQTGVAGQVLTAAVKGFLVHYDNGSATATTTLLNVGETYTMSQFTGGIIPTTYTWYPYIYPMQYNTGDNALVTVDSLRGLVTLIGRGSIMGVNTFFNEPTYTTTYATTPSTTLQITIPTGIGAGSGYVNYGISGDFYNIDFTNDFVAMRITGGFGGQIGVVVNGTIVSGYVPLNNTAAENYALVFDRTTKLSTNVCVISLVNTTTNTVLYSGDLPAAYSISNIANMKPFMSSTFNSTRINGTVTTFDFSGVNII